MGTGVLCGLTIVFTTLCSVECDSVVVNLEMGNSSRREMFLSRIYIVVDHKGTESTNQFIFF